jgi:pimeloyl-ACP methyl ester carboxylesterase
MKIATGADGIRLAYIDEAPQGVSSGAGHADIPILLIHGFASTHAVNWVFPQWVKTLHGAGRRVILYDVRGHGRSDKLYEPEAYTMDVLARDALALLDHLAIDRVDVMGYSMGARIAAFLQRLAPERLRSVIMGGLGHSLVEGGTLPIGIADAMDAPALESLTDPHQRMFRAFADATKSDRRALAACIRGARQLMDADEVARIDCPVLVAVGTADDIAGDPFSLADLLPRGTAFSIEGRDHNKAVGDKSFKAAVLAFLEEQK